jgi:hypothetical protein
MAGTGFQSFVANRAQIPRFATTGIPPWQSALKFRLLTVAIRGTNIFVVAIRVTIFFFVAIRGLNTATYHCTRYTFDRGLSQQSEIQYQPFYIDSPPVRGVVSF